MTEDFYYDLIATSPEPRVREWAARKLGERWAHETIGRIKKRLDKLQ